MILFQGERISCEECIRGHRAADCEHTDKPLFSVKSRGKVPTNKKLSVRLRFSRGYKFQNVTEIDKENGVPYTCIKVHDNTPCWFYRTSSERGIAVIGPLSRFDKYLATYRRNAFPDQNIIVNPSASEHDTEDQSRDLAGERLKAKEEKRVKRKGKKAHFMWKRENAATEQSQSFLVSVSPRLYQQGTLRSPQQNSLDQQSQLHSIQSQFIQQRQLPTPPPVSQLLTYDITEQTPPVLNQRYILSPKSEPYNPIRSDPLLDLSQSSVAEQKLCDCSTYRFCSEHGRRLYVFFGGNVPAAKAFCNGLIQEAKLFEEFQQKQREHRQSWGFEDLFPSIKQTLGDRIEVGLKMLENQRQESILQVHETSSVPERYIHCQATITQNQTKGNFFIQDGQQLVGLEAHHIADSESFSNSTVGKVVDLDSRLQEIADFDLLPTDHNESDYPNVLETLFSSVFKDPAMEKFVPNKGIPQEIQKDLFSLETVPSLTNSVSDTEETTKSSFEPQCTDSISFVFKSENKVNNSKYPANSGPSDPVYQDFQKILSGDDTFDSFVGNVLEEWNMYN